LEFHDFSSDIPNSAIAYSGDECLQMTFAQKPPLKNHVCSGLESPSGCGQRECKYPTILYAVTMDMI
jgi:DNA polymerase zeta